MDQQFQPIIENRITGVTPAVLKILLQDKSTGKSIVWATNDYLRSGDEYVATNEIMPDAVAGPYSIIQPRVLKAAEDQAGRTRRKAEVATPSWICNKMNNLCDAEWFGRAGVFNIEGDKIWATMAGKIEFPEGKTWKQYVDSRRLEITCGEAPFLVSRYDAVTGELIPLGHRIGLLDRKLRVVSENAADEAEWLKWAFRALQSTYGYEYQGDSLILARINVLNTFSDYLRERWRREPTERELAKAANIIAGNLWQADGLKGSTPTCSIEERVICQTSLFDDPDDQAVPCVIRDWRSSETVLYANMEMRRGRRMKFDFAIGNPPYQDETLGENKGYAPPVYHLFLEETYKVSDKVEMIHPARFLFDAGNTPKAWNEKMLHDEHLKVMWFNQDSGQVFPNTYITGGVAVTYRDCNKNFGSIETFTAFPALNTILRKAMPLIEADSLMSIVYNQLRFNLDAVYYEHPELASVIGTNGRDKRFRNNIFEKIPLFTEEKASRNDIPVIGIINGKRVWRYISKKYVDWSHENLWQYKAILSSANGASGTLGSEPARITTAPFIGEPGTGFTQTFISVGSFETENEASACVKYLKSKFTRVMLGILKVTQDNKKPAWKYVPIQDFTTSSDIDWSKPIPDIDRQLYKKYGLTQEEINFIESHVKEME